MAYAGARDMLGQEDLHMWQYLAYAVFIAAGALALWSLYHDLKRLKREISKMLAEAYDERNWH